PGDSILLVNIEGFLDFNTSFIAEALEKKGAKCRIAAISTDDTKVLRKNPSEMRSSNIAKMMSRKEARERFIAEVNKIAQDNDTVILPAVFGLKCDEEMVDVRKSVNGKVVFVGTLPPSVPGVRTQMKLKNAFEDAGGVFLMGDKVEGIDVKDGKVVSVSTSNLEDIRLEADTFVLASGSYFGHGLVTDRDKVSETVFGLDVDCEQDRNKWYNPDFFKSQAYLSFGVVTDNELKGLKSGEVIDNLYVAGSILGGCNPLYEGSGAGIAIMTAMYISDKISNRK
ncbi:MAG: anaerobic glycerol-3-phosphate dehydrogenase subunit GlpB, partial [Candidatus Cryptobacteroides sp.]